MTCKARIIIANTVRILESTVDCGSEDVKVSKEFPGYSGCAEYWLYSKGNEGGILDGPVE
jgi:hypothetical protein